MNSFYTSIITGATRCGGKVYGGFVRGYLIPFLNNRKTSEPRDIDLWFTSETDINDFIEFLKDNFAIEDITKCESNGYGVNVERKNITISEGENRIALDVVLANDIPVNDFDVNTLCYTCKDDVFIPFNYNQEIVDNILNRRAQMLPRYMECIFLPAGWTKTDILLGKIRERFYLKGYKIYIFDKDMMKSEWVERIYRAMGTSENCIVIPT